MKGFTLRISLAASLLVLLSFVAALPTRSDTGRAQTNREPDGRKAKGRVTKGVKQLSYRSPGATHKLLLSADDSDIEQRLMSSRSARNAKNYGQYSLVEVSEAELSAMDAATLDRAQLRDDLNLVMLKPGQIDTTGAEPAIPSDLRQPETSSRALHLVQLFGPPTTKSFEALKATGATIVGYVPNNAYLMWTTRAERQKLHALRQAADGSSLVQWDAPYHPAYKVDRRIKLDSVEQISVSIAILNTPLFDSTVARIEALAHASAIVGPAQTNVSHRHVGIRTESLRLKDLASLADVVAVERVGQIKLHDERQNQIVAGAVGQQNVNNVLVGSPTGPGYLAFLQSVGFTSDFDFAVDVADTGLDLGSADAAVVHPDFLNAAGVSRVGYLNDLIGGGSATDPSGHGTLTASIVGGFSNKPGDAFRDPLGFQYGLGVAPFARIGVSRIFDAEGGGSFQQVFDRVSQAIPAAYASGARISSNSWGAGCDESCNFYDTFSELYDSFVRDANPFADGSQEMTIVFSAGNDGDTAQGGVGDRSISSPGTGKNVITVGATENFRPTDVNGNPARDACRWSTGFADDSQDIFSISAGGRCEDGRSKPDIVAPGSHIVGAATRDSASVGICGLGRVDSYYPPGQELYTWASGTSFSAPAVAGGAALVYQWLKTSRGGIEPSPALVKAFLLNSASYLTGEMGNDTLPGVRQGWGLMNLGRAFEQTNRIIYDQDPARTFTESGGAPAQITGSISDPSKELRVMLVWTDPPGSDVTNAPYVNQLNLEVLVGGVSYNGNHFSGQYSTSGGQKDVFNNVQGVRLPAGTTGPIVIRVRPAVIAGDGVPNNASPLDQDFALVVTNATETAIPVLTVEAAGDVAAGVTVKHPNGTTDTSLIPGELASITVTVRNQSQTTEAMIQSASLALSGTPSSGTFNPIAPGQTGTNTLPFTLQVPSDLRCGSVANLQLQVDTSAGRFTLPVRVQVGRFSVAGGPEERLLFDDVDNFTVKWKKKNGFDAFQGPAKSGTMSYHAVDPGRETDDVRLSQLFMKKVVKIPENAGQVRLSFFHIFNFEPGFDGGVLELSTDEGETWQDAGELILVGGYDGALTDLSENPLGSRAAWTSRGKPGVFSQVVVDLSGFAGKRVKLRFRAGFDFGTGILDGYTGWFIDDIQVTAVMYTCGQSPSAEEQTTTAVDPQNLRPKRRVDPRIE
jgi:hypothetical protein